MRSAGWSRASAWERSRDERPRHLARLHVRFGRNELLRGIDLDVAPGETLVLFGPSGVGKTVLLRAIAGLEPAARAACAHRRRATCRALGPERAASAWRSRISRSIRTCRRGRTSRARCRRARCRRPTVDARVAAVADLLRISHVLGHAPKELSNGQKQRTALARALVGRPQVLLLDDPLRNVDAKLRYEMRLELPRLLRARRGRDDLRVAGLPRGDGAGRPGGDPARRPHRAARTARRTFTTRPASRESRAAVRRSADQPARLPPRRRRRRAAAWPSPAWQSELARRPRRRAGRACLLGVRPETIALSATNARARRAGGNRRHHAAA